MNTNRNYKNIVFWTDLYKIPKMIKIQLSKNETETYVYENKNLLNIIDKQKQKLW